MCVYVLCGYYLFAPPTPLSLSLSLLTLHTLSFVLFKQIIVVVKGITHSEDHKSYRFSCVFEDVEVVAQVCGEGVVFVCVSVA